ncbi:MAG: septal ring lytic transglycosylase RlpA family protein [Candidatus Omnitrophota bacterium]
MYRKNKKFIFIILLALVISVLPSLNLRRDMLAYATRPQPSREAIGHASWYSKKSPGIKKRTANNEIFDDTALTCAMWGVRFNQKLRITNLQNGKSVIVRVNDRGPHKRLVRKGRILDLTKRAFVELAPSKNGLIQVKIEFL